MNILQINNLDLAGRRFNGYDLNDGARRYGHHVSQYVFQKHSDNPDVQSINYDVDLYKQIDQIQQTYDLHNLLMPYGRVLMQLPKFEQADVVHYHLIHNQILALPDFPALTQKKTTVWSWHDPWAVTGHCVHPKTCQGWKTGCNPCPHLGEYFPLKTDQAGTLWRWKEDAYRQMDADIVVSSDFMMDFARSSPLGQCFSRVHKIPFGIQLDQFAQVSQQQARAELKIRPNDFVIAFRNEKNPYKGVCYIEKMLSSRADTKDITLLTIGTDRIPRSIARRYHCVELGWVSDSNVLSNFYTACDVFLMPSVAESFGLMAVEAMASSRPVVCFEGTALPSVTYAPECGIAVPLGDTVSLGAVIQRLKEHPEERQRRGELGRIFSEENYRFEDYVQRHLELYKEVIARRR